MLDSGSLTYFCSHRNTESFDADGSCQILNIVQLQLQLKKINVFNRNKVIKFVANDSRKKRFLYIINLIHKQN